MRSPKLVAAGALSGAAAVALATVLTGTAFATTVPTSAGCLTAQNQLNADQVILQAARNKLASDEAAGDLITVINTDDAAISQAQAIVSQDQAAVNIQCGTTGGVGIGGGGHPHPWPWPTPVPAPTPVGIGFLTCAQLANRGLSNIPAGNPFYRRSLDANGDGIACETAPTQTFRVINGQNCHLVNGTWVPVTPPPPPVTIVAPGCACPTPAPVVAPPPVLVPAPATQTIVEQIPTVTVPPAQAFTTQVVPSIPETSAGDGSLRVDPTPIVPVASSVVTVTLNLGGVLHLISLPRLPVIPVLPTP